MHFLLFLRHHFYAWAFFFLYNFENSIIFFWEALERPGALNQLSPGKKKSVYKWRNRRHFFSGCTWKIFLLNFILLAIVWKENKIALASASSGIAATFLDYGKTAHSAFKLPLDFNETVIPSQYSKTATNCSGWMYYGTLLAGDFRQTLSVIPKSTPADEMNSYLETSYLCNKVTTINLFTNMRSAFEWCKFRNIFTTITIIRRRNIVFLRRMLRTYFFF